MKQLKKLLDEQKKEVSEKLALLNLKDRDNTIFNFEADIKKVFKQLDLKKLIKHDKEYINGVKSFILNMIKKFYLKDIINVGVKKANRFKREYLEPANG